MFSSPWAAPTILFFNFQNNKISGEQLCCNRLIKNVAVYKLFAGHDNYWINKSGFSTRLHDSMIVSLDEQAVFLPPLEFILKSPLHDEEFREFSYEDVQIEANISLARPIMKYSHPGVTLNVFFRSDIHREGDESRKQTPRGQNTIWLIDFMICKQFMRRNKIFLSHFILLLNVVRDTMKRWHEEGKWKRKISRLFTLNILFRAFLDSFRHLLLNYFQQKCPPVFCKQLFLCIPSDVTSTHPQLKHFSDSSSFFPVVSHRSGHKALKATYLPATFRFVIHCCREDGSKRRVPESSAMWNEWESNFKLLRSVYLWFIF